MADQSDAVRGAARVVEIVADRYADASAARALVQLIPGVGGALDALIGGEGARIQQRRLLQMLESLRLEMALLTAQIDTEFITSEAFYDWFVATAEKITRTADEEHAKALRMVFINGVCAGTGDDVQKLLVLRAVDNFTRDHVRVLREIHTLEGPDLSSPELPPLDQYISVERVAERCTDLGPTTFTAVVNDLYRLAILAGRVPTTYGAGSGQPEAVVLSLFGRIVVKFLSAPNNDERAA